MSLIPAAIIGGSIISGLFGKSAADKQASAARDAANQSNQVQWDMFQQSRDDMAPWRDAGVNALSQLNQAQGGDLSGFYNSPTYKLGRENAQRALDRINAAGGRSLSGSAILNNNRLGADLFGQYRNNLASMAGVGQTATNNIATLGQNTANQVGQNTMNAGTAAGNARASAYGSMNNAVQGGIQNYMLYNYLNPAPTTNAFSWDGSHLRG